MPVGREWLPWMNERSAAGTTGWCAFSRIGQDDCAMADSRALANGVVSQPASWGPGTPGDA